MMILDESIQNESSFESLNLREATPSVKRVNFAESDGELSFQQKSFLEPERIYKEITILDERRPSKRSEESIFQSSVGTVGMDSEQKEEMRNYISSIPLPESSRRVLD